VFHEIKPLYALNFLLFALFTAASVSRLLLQVDAIHRVLNRPSLTVLQHIRNVGIWSYSIYLLHQPLLSLPKLAANYLNSLFAPAGADLINIHPIAMILACAGLWFFVVLLGAWFYQLVELPSSRLGKWLSSHAVVKVHQSGARAI
jgi:peptidoglycan/LPS O-acetylase OafA/YrhL